MLDPERLQDNEHGPMDRLVSILQRGNSLICYDLIIIASFSIYFILYLHDVFTFVD